MREIPGSQGRETKGKEEQEGRRGWVPRPGSERPLLPPARNRGTAAVEEMLPEGSIEIPLCSSARREFVNFMGLNTQARCRPGEGTFLPSPVFTLPLR